MNSVFCNKFEEFLADFGKARKMVLSTVYNNAVSSRMMSVVQINGLFYFQTDINLRKYRQIKSNNSAALCIDNIQVEGICKEIGHPLDNSLFCKAFEESFKGSYDAYTGLRNERLFCLKPVYIERWIYKSGIPYIEVFDMNIQKYSLTQYSGE